MLYKNKGLLTVFSTINSPFYCIGPLFKTRVSPS